MSVSAYFGLTESGKSYHVQNHVIPSWDRVVIFDNAHCFKGSKIMTGPTDKALMEAFRLYRGGSGYCLVIRPGRVGSPEVLFNKTVQLSLALGRAIAPYRVDPALRLQMVTDEADFVCSPNYQSGDLKHLVNKGRHDNVDCHFIARNPMRLHTDIRVNASKIVTFRLQNSGEIPLFRDNFGSEISRKIRELPKYWRLEWKDNGETAFYNEKNQKMQNLPGISQKIAAKSKGA